MYILVNWLLSALALWLVTLIVPGIRVRGYGTALMATAVLAVVNILIGWPLRLITFPLTILTLGLFRLVVNAFLLKLASLFVPGFTIDGFLPAFLGSIVLTILGYVLRAIVFSSHAGLFY
ncbi:MAG: phage holin family protein [Bryobacteraceae bacterium]